jgi:hypothetical protein
MSAGSDFTPVIILRHALFALAKLCNMRRLKPR